VLFTVLYVPAYPFSQLRILVVNLTSGARRRAQREQREAEEFDRKFQVDTGGLIPLEDVDVVGENRDHGHSYLGILPGAFRELLAAIPVAHERYIFIDFGSGKGRALLIAAEFPFKAVIGVEFAPELHRIAEANIRVDSNPARRCRDIRTLCMDVAEFDLPPEPAVLYFYNPFSEKVLSSVLERVERSLRESPRDLWIGYFNLWANRPLDRAPFLEPVTTTPNFRVYRARNSSGDGRRRIPAPGRE
jgi:SAM-dependent methyltransferase